MKYIQKSILNLPDKAFIKLVVRSFTTAAFLSYSAQVCAGGGISIQGTRIIYPAGQKQEEVILSNSSLDQSFLVDSWVEDPTGHRSKDFVITPPLYVSWPKKENSLRLIYTGGQLPTDRESLYYFVTKAIPSLNKDQATQGGIHIATANRIKIFVRPEGLQPAVGQAADKLNFRQVGKQVFINNPTPYYLTVVNLSINGKVMKDIMVPPKGQVPDDIPAGKGGKLSFQVINDFGALSQKYTKQLQ